MSTMRVFAMIGVGLLMVITPQAKADEWNQKTVFTFSQPVEIPGKVLPAGTYVFKLADSEADRNVVEVYNKDENHLYGIFLAIPDYHMRPANKPIITFEERATGSPEAVKAWFYPGDNYGHDFVYPKSKALELAKANNQAVPSMPNEVAANTAEPAKSVTAMKKAPLMAQKPSQEEVAIAEVFPPAPPAQSPAPMPNQLPKTASDFPLIGLIGLLSLGAAWSLRRIGGRTRPGGCR